MDDGWVWGKSTRSGVSEESPLESFGSQIRGMFGSLDSAGQTAAEGARLSKPPEGEWVSEMNGDQIPL